MYIYLLVYTLVINALEPVLVEYQVNKTLEKFIFTYIYAMFPFYRC